MRHKSLMRCDGMRGMRETVAAVLADHGGASPEAQAEAVAAFDRVGVMTLYQLDDLL